ncbi:MAG: hypothetical protein WD887_00165 [Candidatus Saccharimonadales bacterium]
MKFTPELITRSPRLAAVIAAGGLAVSGCGTGESDTKKRAQPEQKSSADAALVAQTVNETTPTPTVSSKESAVTGSQDQDKLKLLCDAHVFFTGPSFGENTAEEVFIDAIGRIPEVLPAGTSMDDVEKFIDHVEFSKQGPNGGPYDIPIETDTIIPNMETIHGEFGKDC